MTVARASVASRLAAIAGSAHVSADPPQLAPYAIDGKTPAAVARPGSAEEAAEIVKFAAAENLAIVPAGARTKLSMGMPPREYDLALDMSRLDRVVAYDPGDLTLGVEAGIPLRALAATLAEHRQFLPLAPPFMNRATAGGTIASGVDSPLRQFYGAARDYVLGMEFITGDGALVKSGGRVVKNVAGYDLHKLMIGALGTLGVITKINFRTFPLPASSRMVAAAFEGAPGALGMRDRVAQSPLAPATLEILSPGAAALLAGDAAVRVEGNSLGASLLSATSWNCAASFAGNEAVIVRYERELRRMAEESGAVDASVLGADHTSHALARIREFAPIALESSSPATTIVKIGVPPARMKEILEAAADAAEADSLPWAALARGVGVIYFALLPQECSEEARLGATRTTGEILAASSALGGHATIPWCPDEWKSALAVWGLARGDFSAMENVKKAFDPRGVFSPGRFVGGL
ncbi:MAG: FAD-binding oxidoreductase [Candidatus Acidiferrales bacterium]